MADIGVRVTVQGAHEGSKDVDDLAKKISDLEKSARAPIKSLNDLDKSLASLFNLQKTGAITSLEAERRAKALGDAYGHFADDVIPKAVKGLDQLARNLGNAAVSASGLGGQARAVQGVSEALEGVGGMSGRTALAFAAVGAAAAVGIGILVSKMYDAVASTTALGDHMNNLSQRTGIAVEKLSGGLRIAAETTGSSIDALATGMNQLNRAISEAADGTGKQAEAFKRLGIEVVDSSGKLKSADQVLEEIATAFAGAEDGAVKAEIAMLLLGRAGVNLIPLLNQGADGLNKLEREAKLAGITMDKETAEAASKLNENMRVLEAYGEGFWIEVASPMVDGLAKITTAIRDARRESESWLLALRAGAKAAFEAMFLPNAKQQLSTLGDQEKRAITEINRLENIKSKAGRGQWSGMHEQNLQSLYDQLRNINQGQRDLQGQVYVESPQFAADMAGPKVTLPPPTTKPKAGREQTNSQIVSEYLSYYENMVKIGEMTRDEQLAFLDEMAVEFQSYEDERVKIAVAAAAIRKNITSEETKTETKYWTDVFKVQEQKDADTLAMWKASENYKKTSLKELQSVQDRAAQSELRQINETTFMFKEQKIAAVQDLIDKYEEMGDVGADGAKRMRGEMEALKGTTRATGVIVQDVGFDMGKVWQGVHTGLTQAIGDVARYALGIGDNIKSLGDALKGFFLSIVNSIIDMFAKVAANKVFEWLFSGGGAATGAGVGGSLLSGAASGAAGAAVGGGGGIGGIFSAGGSISNLFSGNGVMGSIGSALGIGGVASTSLAGEAVLSGLMSSAELGALGGSSMMAGIGAALPWVGGAIAIAGLLGAFDDDGESERHVFGTRPGDRILGDPFGTVYIPGTTIPVTKQATGTDMIVSKPTFFQAGETGTERVTVSPIGAAHRGGGGGATINVTGLSLMDNFAARRLAYELRRAMA